MCRIILKVIRIQSRSIVTVLQKRKKVKEIPVIMRELTAALYLRRAKAVYYMVKVTLAVLIAAIR